MEQVLPYGTQRGTVLFINKKYFLIYGVTNLIRQYEENAKVFKHGALSHHLEMKHTTHS